MNKFIALAVLIILAVICFIHIAGKDAIGEASKQPMSINVEQTVERKIP